MKKNYIYYKISLMSSLNKFIDETIKAKEAHTDAKAINTLIQGKRDIAFVSFVTDEIINFMKKYGVNVVKVDKNPYDSYIFYKPKAEKNAMELLQIANKYNGFLPAAPEQTTEDIVRRIGHLLEYDPEDIDNFIQRNFQTSMVAEHKSIVRNLIKEYISKFLTEVK